MFKPRIFTLFKFDACYRSQKSWHGFEKARNFENIQLGEHLATNEINWHQVCNMISYKRDVLERQSLSELKMGRGSPICERVRKKIVENFKNNVPQCQIAKALQISSSTVHNMIKSFRKTGEISVRKGQGWRPLLDACGLRALRRHCITHRHDSVIDITKWAQEYFQKPLSVNTIRRAIYRCQLKLYHVKRRHMWTWSRSAVVSCGPRLI